MTKVLLVYDDFSELTLTETYLKKVGFDIVGISNEILIYDQILSFNPEILVVHGKNIKVSNFSVAQKLKESQKSHRAFHGKVVIVLPRGVRPTTDQMIKMKMDGVVEAPVNPERLIQVLCRLALIPLEPILEKLHRAQLSDPELKKKLITIPGAALQTDKISVTGGPWGGKVPLEDSARMAKYQELIKDVHIDTEKSSYNRQELKEIQKDLKKDLNFEQIEKQDELKRQMAEALFKKNT